MARAFYSDYVKHCLRFYARYENPKFTSESDKKNWKASEEAVKSFTEKEQAMILSIYTGNETIPEKVGKLAKENGLKTDTVWKLINDLERKVAKKRGLL